MMITIHTVNKQNRCHRSNLRSKKNHRKIIVIGQIIGNGKYKAILFICQAKPSKSIRPDGVSSVDAETTLA